jgi:two-component system cell cycle sensor histidine kinase PleC
VTRLLIIFHDVLVGVRPHGRTTFRFMRQGSGATENDSAYVLSCHVEPLLNGRGRIIGLRGLVQNITKYQSQEQLLKEALHRAEGANRAKAGFLATVSHELRTPLNAIIGFSEMMQAELLGPLGNERYNDYAKSIQQSGKHLLDLINDLLDMSKIEAGKYDFALETLNVAKIARMAVHMIEPSALAGGVLLHNEIPESSLTVRADRRALMQILLNLLSNAVKFTPRGGHIELRLCTETRPMMITFAVADTGIGIPIDKIDRVTEPFEQVSNAMTRHYQGTGLGLAITKKLVEHHGGILRIDSALGHGTTVYVTLPLDEHETQFTLFDSEIAEP